jgi:hypothetical protein
MEDLRKVEKTVWILFAARERNYDGNAVGEG